MKLNRIVLSIALPLAVIIATSGCKTHSTPPKTPLPQHPAATGPTTEPPLPDTKPLMPEAPPVSTPVIPPYTSGPITTASGWQLVDYNQDPAKLAAYTVHFKFDSAVVEDKEQASLASVSDALKSDANAKLLVEGHCDERGTEEYNRSLGERRALALREALAKVGVDPERIRTVSYGKDKPVDPGHDESAWSKNRRGEFIWCTPKSPTP